MTTIVGSVTGWLSLLLREISAYCVSIGVGVRTFSSILVILVTFQLKIQNQGTVYHSLARCRSPAGVCFILCFFIIFKLFIQCVLSVFILPHPQSSQTFPSSLSSRLHVQNKKLRHQTRTTTGHRKPWTPRVNLVPFPNSSLSVRLFP